MILIRIIMLMLLMNFFTQLSAARQTVIDLEHLKSLYQEFRYNEVIRLGEEVLYQNLNLSQNEQCELYRLLALSYYTEQNMQGALKNFSAILKLDSNYHLDPRENSPKILAFFEEIRHQLRESEQAIKSQKRDSTMIIPAQVLTGNLESVTYKHMALSLVVPGSGQIWRNQKTKGWLLLGGNTIFLGASIYFSVETNRLEDQYLQVVDPDRVSAAYREYNEVYKKRNFSLAGFVLLWLYTQVDFMFLSAPTQQQPSISWHPTIDGIGGTKLNIVLTF